MQEKRQHKRFALKLEEISGKLALANYLKIIDISIGGISFQTDRRLNVNREYKLEIEYNGKVLPIIGIVIWSLLSKSKKDDKGNVAPVYKAGMKFTHISKEQLEELIYFIKEPMKVKNDSHLQHEELINLSEYFKNELRMFSN